jgi:uncharacterized protein (DUF1499 family)
MFLSIVKWLLIASVVLALAAVVAGQWGLLQGTPPDDLGVNDGRLKRPSKTPNSVSSQADLWPGHPQQDYARIAPLPLLGDGPQTLQRLQALVKAHPGAVVVKAEPDYLYATFTTRLMKYTDDVEFWFDPAAQVVQVRSASRLGRKDFGANRARVEALRAQLVAR